jgi:predicted N-formylglutamate amidohydrolase
MLNKPGLLTLQEGEPVAIENMSGAGKFLFVCEHASRTIPEALGTLGLSAEALVSHIAWDPGALAISRMMAKSLNSALIFQRFSRLAYDCNRPPEAADAMPAISEIYTVPGNADLDEHARRIRTEALYLPFTAALADLISKRRASGQETVLVTVHSFTPVYKGQSRAVEIGILHDADSRLADAMLALASNTKDFDVRRNAPYGPQDGVTHTLKRHGLENGLLNVMIEVRNDLIQNEIAQGVIADYLSGLLLQGTDGLSQ